jgi:hypothetical protein
MFAKIFAQIFDSSIARDHLTRHVFMDLLVLADRDGVVDMTMDAISRRTNVPIETVQTAIAQLTSPDGASRSCEEDGKRLVQLDSHRDWGWQIVNYDHYRNLVDEESRRSYFRDKKREQRSGATGRKRGYVYYMQTEVGIKIGYSGNPWTRLEEMKCFAPNAVLLAVEPGDMKLEQERHRQFSSDRIDREWFKITDQLRSHVATLATSNQSPATAATSTQGEAEGEGEAEAETEGERRVTPLTSDAGSELMLANWILEEAGIVADNGTRRIVAESVRLLAKEGGTTQDAAKFILAAAQRAVADGETINRFWFTDQRYRPQKPRKGKKEAIPGPRDAPGYEEEYRLAAEKIQRETEESNEKWEREHPAV